MGKVTDRAHNNHPRRGGAGQEEREEQRGRGGTTVGRGDPIGGRRNVSRLGRCDRRSGPRPAAGVGRAGGAAWLGRDDRPRRGNDRRQRPAAGAKERSAAQSSVSFPLEKETEEPPPLSFPCLSDLTVSIRRSCKNK